MTAYIGGPNLKHHLGGVWLDCESAGQIHVFEVDDDFSEEFAGPPHMLVCRHCLVHLHADFEVRHAQTARGLVVSRV